MELRLAFSRDTRGLAYDHKPQDLLEKGMSTRYIDTLIVEQAATVSELVMSKKQGGRGGYLYVCCSVAVFNFVMNGIRKAIYNYRSSSMEAANTITNKAFAERCFMLDVFMTPKPLPCNPPAILVSQLACQTGHRLGCLFTTYVLGVIAGAQTSHDAIDTPKEVAFVGQFVYESSSSIRFAERGNFNYAAESVELDIELLEDIRKEDCHGIDAFDSIAAMGDSGSTQSLTVLATFLMQTLERMSKRLEVFYSKLARLKVCQPELENNPARARWDLVRTKVRDGSFFILAQRTAIGAAPAYAPKRSHKTVVDFNDVMNRFQASVHSAPVRQTLNAMHLARAATPRRRRCHVHT
ncbi:hypothetical protein VTI74DRAFT_5971 [Chaetomium olivicolor]